MASIQIFERQGKTGQVVQTIASEDEYFDILRLEKAVEFLAEVLMVGEVEILCKIVDVI